MPWNQHQKDTLLALVEQGWQTHCQAHPDLDQTDKTAKIKWYQEHMLICAGHPSIETLGNDAAYDIVTAHFTALTE